jgi:membrane protein implicated in regulation of membrane protease activity
MLNDLTSFLFAWYNLPFTILLIACIVLAVFQLMGLGGDHDSEGEAGVDHDADFDHDADLDHDADVDHDIDHDVDHDMDHDVSHDTGSDAGSSALNILAFIGLGKAPLLVVLLILFGSIGLLGWTLNSFLTRTFGAYPSMAFVAVLPITIVVGTLISSRSARCIGRALPPISTTATRAQALVGRRGTVISPFVDTKYGMVHLRDDGGTLLNVFAVIQDGEPIRRGSEITLVAYDPLKRVYTITSV